MTTFFQGFAYIFCTLLHSYYQLRLEVEFIVSELPIVVHAAQHPRLNALRMNPPSCKLLMIITNSLRLLEMFSRAPPSIST